MKEEKVNQQIKNNLFSPKTEVVLDALKQIKLIGNRFYIPLLFDLLATSPEKEIEEEITKILGTVKDKETVNSFMRGIEDNKYQSIRKNILVACWQNGLDYSTFLPVFIDQVINEDWEIAFEAFTVIDNLEKLPGEPILKVSIEKIKNSMEIVTDQKKYFLNEILLKLEE
ncbi:MAG: hypothetical protein JXR61_10855 [Prolixibacteraceae bacterium]|nr:hypothetical protein [Prolixibacteraceae bacterium]